MIALANAITPALDSATVRKMLEAALAGRVVVIEDNEKSIIENYTLPNAIEFSITSKCFALYLAGELIKAVSQQHNGEILATPFVFGIVGSASIKRDDFTVKYDLNYSR